MILRGETLATKKPKYNANNIKVIEESETGANERFLDTKTGKEFSRNEFVKEIEAGNVENAHVMKIDGKKIPRTNPDKRTDNNFD
ncbi:DUF3892 domain-containing protein [Methanococcus voltae]|uniref:DUF3892 domain-containing protein n=1 Tax=Methanococcus voltae TaxID=2188 RepID=A0A8J7RID2_METVO|nr:DUF3892 domain-containing protein [Methanococcus voltae]MBP2173192.1 hypothetical protein [Methanococcus voltae]MBP2202015.1 hypothetical protein [Methanococcus voltae]